MTTRSIHSTHNCVCALCVCVVWWMIQLSQMEHRCTTSLPHALWSSNRQVLMHSLMWLWLTKRMVIVNNAGTNPAPSSVTCTGRKTLTSRVGDVAVLFSFHDFRRRWEVKAFFCNQRCEIWLREKPELSYSLSFKELRSWCSVICWTLCVFWGIFILVMTFIWMFHISCNLQRILMEINTFTVAIIAELTWCKWNEFQLRMLF